jgi:hypothetical protein
LKKFATFIACVALTACAQQTRRDTAQYQLVENPAESSQPTARQILDYLAAGDIESAAKLSNAPDRRAEVLREFRSRVGEEEFKRVYREYLAPGNRVIAEIALGPRRLVVWQLGTAKDRVAGQYFVLVDGRFLMDDERSSEREALAQTLNSYRRSTN